MASSLSGRLQQFSHGECYSTLNIALGDNPRTPIVRDDRIYGLVTILQGR